MITISTSRHWLICSAATANDSRIVTVALGLTREAARRRLHRKLDRQEYQ